MCFHAILFPTKAYNMKIFTVIRCNQRRVHVWHQLCRHGAVFCWKCAWSSSIASVRYDCQSDRMWPDFVGVISRDAVLSSPAGHGDVATLLSDVPLISQHRYTLLALATMNYNVTDRRRAGKKRRFTDDIGARHGALRLIYGAKYQIPM